jgi:hypothetical protein
MSDQWTLNFFSSNGEVLVGSVEWGGWFGDEDSIPENKNPWLLHISNLVEPETIFPNVGLIANVVKESIDIENRTAAFSCSYEIIDG